VRDLLEDPAANVSTAGDAGHFWVMVAALKRFVEEQGAGSLPLEVCSPPLCCRSERMNRASPQSKEGGGDF